MKDGEQYNPDVNNSFLIVARAIERMSVMPNESEIKLIERIATMLAIEQTLDVKQSRYPGIFYTKSRDSYEASFQYKNKTYKCYDKSDQICFQKLTILKNKVKNEKRG